MGVLMVDSEVSDVISQTAESSVGGYLYKS